MGTRKLQTPAEPTTLLPFLLAALHETKRTRVKELLRSGFVHVNDFSVTRHDHPIHPGDSIAIHDERTPAARKIPFTVLYEDNALLAIEKPNGLLTIATAAEKARTVYSIVNHALAATRERVFIVHRLDKYTSGVLLLAKSEEVKERVMSNWQAAEKTYHAIVEGTPDPPRQTLVHELREDVSLIVHAMKNPTRDSQRAVMTYDVVRSNRTHSLLRIELETGRKNQIRAQLTAIGHPIAGDEKYGAQTNPIGRLCLHASTLSIPHPTTGDRLVFDSPLPEAMQRMI